MLRVTKRENIVLQLTSVNQKKKASEGNLLLLAQDLKTHKHRTAASVGFCALEFFSRIFSPFQGNGQLCVSPSEQVSTFNVLYIDTIRKAHKDTSTSGGDVEVSEGDGMSSPRKKITSSGEYVEWSSNLSEPSSVKEKFTIKKGKSLFSGKLVSIIPGGTGVCSSQRHLFSKTLTFFRQRVHREKLGPVAQLSLKRLSSTCFSSLY